MLMAPERWRHVKTVFSEAIAMPPADRGAYLDTACASDVTLRDDVERMIRAYESADDFLETPALGHSLDLPRFSDATANDADAPPSLENHHLDQFEIIAPIAHGGMGCVYRARQSSPDRDVALKIMKTSLRSSSARRRFEYESKTLARLNHPNIAHVYHAATCNTPDGELPYFAMEFIPDAQPITHRAESLNLTITQRIQLMIDVCDAVQHAHTRGVIHRDIKPANILVDAANRPKLIDFGVALLADQDPLATLDTTPNRIIGTLQYMSPEQCDASHDAVDFRADIYALGLVLYELATDARPYDLSQTPIAKAAAVIRELNPAKPSTQNPKIPRDLETVILKAIQKDPDRRYASAERLAADLQAILESRPISARPPSATDHFLKWTRRHKAATALGATLAIGAVATIAALTTLSSNLADARDDAIAQAEKANRVNLFLNSIFHDANPKKTSHDITARELVDRAVARINTEFPDDPEIEAEIREAIGGSVYWTMGELEKARVQLDKARNLRIQTEGLASDNAVGTTADLANLLRDLGTHDEARHLLNQSLDALNPSDPRRAALLDTLARSYTDTHEHEKASQTITLALNLLRDNHNASGDAPSTQEGIPKIRRAAELIETLAQSHYSRADFNESIRLQRQGLAIRQFADGADHIGTIEAAGFLAGALTDRATPEDLAEAESMFRDCLARITRVLGPDHLDGPWIEGQLARNLARQGRDAEAVQRFERAINQKRHLLGDNHIQLSNTLESFAQFHAERNRLDRAVKHYTRSYEIQRHIYGHDDPRVVCAAMRVAETLLAADRNEEARSLCRAQLEIARSTPNLSATLPHLQTLIAQAESTEAIPQ